jgi:hypothetical protein
MQKIHTRWNPYMEMSLWWTWLVVSCENIQIQWIDFIAIRFGGYCMQHSSAYSGSAHSWLNTLELTCSTVDPHRMSSVWCKLLAVSHINIIYSGSTKSNIPQPCGCMQHSTAIQHTVGQHNRDSIQRSWHAAQWIHTGWAQFDANC